jgi:hypothetical protein
MRRVLYSLEKRGFKVCVFPFEPESFVCVAGDEVDILADREEPNVDVVEFEGLHDNIL